MRASVWALAIAFVVPTLAGARAQMFDGIVADILHSQLGTASVEASEILEGEVPRRCELSYSAMVQDFKYREGAFMSLEGSIAFERGAEETPRLLLGLAVEYIDSESGHGTPYAPGNVYLVRNSETIRGEHLGSERREADGSIVTEYDAAATRAMVFESLREGAIALAFEREPFVLTAPFEIDPTVVETDYNGERKHSPAMRDEFLSCSERFFAAAGDE
jgi:hypothetical protein